MKYYLLALAIPFAITTSINAYGQVAVDTLIKECPENYCDELHADMTYYVNYWKDVPNPFVATYRGNEFGDYFHVIFEINDTLHYDFGFGDNQFDAHVLYENGGDYADNPDYLDKRFEVHWAWRISIFPCCSGAFERAVAYMPSIVGLKLVK